MLYKACLLDMDGVLYRGDQPINGAARFLRGAVGLSHYFSYQ